ncbi:hypothetical protein PIB30_095676 [Stylosanthes scabra]|uniref:Uncharacterized protein n=1 Tax=Stylosanthes scabra TaxID=79078 RepID=A0ABU6YVE2_9FABA|nr:hypothetical protein [Stylosanthes scabra]
MKEAEEAGPRSILPSSKAQTTSSGVLASGTVPAPSIPPVSSSAASKATGKSTSAAPANPFFIENEEGAKEDPAADLRQKKRKRKVSEASAEEAALGDTGLTNAPIREVLEPLVLEQLLGTAQFLACQLTACLQVGVEKTFVAKVQLGKELAAAREQVDVLTAERDSALAAPLLHAKIKSLTEELERAEGERLSTIARMEEVERKAKAQVAELEPCRSALTQEEKKVESLSQSLKGKQMALDEAAAVHWRDEWRSLGEETGEMVQEIFEILMDQVRHLNPAIDYSMITMDTHWDPKAKRIYNPKADAHDQPEPAVKQPEPEAEE